jgi:hypothetical protein
MLSLSTIAPPAKKLSSTSPENHHSYFCCYLLISETNTFTLFYHTAHFLVQCILHRQAQLQYHQQALYHEIFYWLEAMEFIYSSIHFSEAQNH